MVADPDPQRSKHYRGVLSKNGIDTETLPSIRHLPKWRSLIEQTPVSLTSCSSTDVMVPVTDNRLVLRRWSAPPKWSRGVHDVQLPHVSLLIKNFIDPDDRGRSRDDVEVESL